MLQHNDPTTAIAFQPALPDWHDDVRRLIERCGTNKHDRAIVFISAVIGEGVTSGPDIIALGGKFGLNRSHVAMILHKEAGANIERHRWCRGSDSTYSLLV